METPVTPMPDSGASSDAPMDAIDESNPDTYWEIDEGKNEDGSKKTRKVSLSEARKFAQKGFGADKTFQEATAARQEALAIKNQVAQLTRLMKEDPWQVMTALGLDPNKLIKSRFERELEESLLDPRDRQLRDQTAELEHYRQLKAEALKKHEESQIQAKVQEYQGKLLGKIDEALKVNGIPNNATTVGEIGRYLQSLHGKQDSNGNQINVFEIPLDHIVKHVHSRFNSSFNEIADKSDDDSLLNNIDPKILKRLLAAHTKKLESSGALLQRNAPVNNIDGFQKNSNEPARKSQRELELEHAKKIQKLDEVWKKKNPNKYA